jgi:hypothetical protein
MSADHPKFTKLLDKLAAHPLAVGLAGFIVSVSVMLPSHLVTG